MQDYNKIKESLRLLSTEDQEKALTYLSTELQQTKNNEKAQLKLTLEEKKNIAKDAILSNNNSQISKKYGVCEGTVRNYIRLLSEEEKEAFQKNAKPGKSKLPKFIQLEIKLLLWFIKQCKNKLPISSKDIREEALRIFNEIYTDNNQIFKASNGWLMRFQDRWKITFRKSTHSITQLTNKVLDNIQQLHQYVKEYRNQSLIAQRKLIYINIDEVPLQFDMSGKGTLEFKGSQNIEIIKSNGSHKRLTLVLGLTSVGNFLPPMIIFKTKLQQEIQNPYPKKCIITKNNQGWQTSGLYLTYLKSVIGNYCLLEDQQIILFQDSFRGHLTSEVKNWCSENKVKVFDLPAGSTGFVQPVDTSISKKLKSEIIQYQSEFIKNQVNNQNQNQKYVQVASYQNLIEWILNSLENFDKELLISSFKHCGFTLNLDGTEDEKLNKRLQKSKIYSPEVQDLLLNIIQNKDDDINEEANILQQMLNSQNQLTFDIDPQVAYVIEEKFQTEQDVNVPNEFIQQVFKEYIDNSNDQSQLNEKQLTEMQDLTVQINIENEYQNEIKNQNEEKQNNEDEEEISDSIFFKSINNNKIRIAYLDGTTKQMQDEIVQEQIILQNFQQDIQFYIKEYEFEVSMSETQQKSKSKSKPKPKQNMADQKQLSINSFFKKV